MLFRGFAGAFKGARQLTYSKGLRDDAASDEEIAAENVGVEVCSIERGVYQRAIYRGLGAGLLDAAEDAGMFGVIAFLASHGSKGGVLRPAPNEFP